MAIDKQKVNATAQKLIGKGAYEKAIRELRKIIDEEPDDVRTLLKIGNLYSRKGDNKSACEIYFDVARFYQAGGFYQKSVAVYKQIAKLQPERIDVIESIGELYRAQGLTRDALAQYRNALERYRDGQDIARYGHALGKMVDIEPSNNGLRLRYAEHLSKQKRTNEAVLEFQIVARSLKSDDNTREYIKVAERIIDHRPHDVEILKDLVRLYLNNNESRHALAKLQSLYRIDAQDHETLELLSRAFLQLDQTKKALNVLKELARVYESVFPDPDLAKRTWRRVLALSPTDIEARGALPGELSANVPMLADSAIIALEDDLNIVELDGVAAPPPEEPEPGLTLEEQIEQIITEIDVCLRYNLVDQAVDHLETLFEIAPQYLPGRERLARLFRLQGKIAEAAAELREMAKSCWANDKDLALKYVRLAVGTEPNSEETSELLLSFGLDPSEFGVARAAVGRRTGPLPPPVPKTTPPTLSPGDLMTSPAPTTRRNIATLPPDALIEVDGSGNPMEAPTPSKPVARVGADSQPDFDLSAIDEVLDLPEEPKTRSHTTNDTQEFAALFDLDVDDEIDNIFGGSLITGTFAAISDDVSMDPFGVTTTPVSIPQATQALSADELLNLQDDLAELAFYNTQGMIDEARSALDDLRQRYGAHPLIEDAAARISEP